MTEPELYLIRLDRTNKAAFQALFPQTVPVANPTPETVADCTKLNDPEHEAAVRQFLTANKSTLLPHIHNRKRTHYLYCHSGEPPKEPPKPVPRPVTGPTEDDPDYTDYISNLKKLISVKLIHGGQAIEVKMDPLPIGDEIAILFRGQADKPWAIASAMTRPKIDYMRDLVAHTDIPGLPAQMGITRFKDGTQILNRFYLMNYLLSDGTYKNKEHELRVATLYTRKPDGSVSRNLSNEDFLLSQFLRPEQWLDEHIKKYGEVVEFKRISNVQQCAPFMMGDGQFAINKTKNLRDDGYQLNDDTGKIIPIIGGNFLQVDDDNNPIIQQDDASVLEPIMYEIANEKKPVIQVSEEILDVVITTSHAPGTASVQAWWTRDVKRVASITEPTKGTVKVQFTDNSYLLDTGNQLSLHDYKQDDDFDKQLIAMVEHAEKYWDGKLNIVQANEDVKKRLWLLASFKGLVVTGYEAKDSDERELEEFKEIWRQENEKAEQQNAAYRPGIRQPKPHAGTPKAQAA